MDDNLLGLKRWYKPKLTKYARQILERRLNATDYYKTLTYTFCLLST